MPNGHRHPSTTGWIRWQGVILVLIAASSWPLHILTVNLFEIVRPERVIGIVLVTWVGGLLLIGLMTRLGMDVQVAEQTIFLLLVLVMSGGLILRQFGWLAYVILLAFPVLAGWLLTRLKGHLVVNALIWATAVALATGPVFTFVDSWSARGGPSVMEESASLSVELVERPDIFLVVFDGYPGLLAAEQDGLDSGEVDVVPELRRRGFEVPASSWSAYWNTTLSIPSLLEMDYPVAETQWRGSETLSDLYVALSGTNKAVESLRTNGYTTHMIESGWAAASCGPWIDHCVPSPLLDEATYLTLRHTVAWSLINDSPGPYVRGTLAGFEWLLGHAAGLSGSDSPDFVFMHVVSPHPPLLLTADCSVDLTADRTGSGFNLTGVSPDDRAQYLVEQMDCLDRQMLGLADAVEDDDIVIFVSDHGTDRRDQGDPEVVDWNREAIVERLNNFLAVQLPDRCSVGEQVVAPNVLRSVMDCLTSSEVARVPERMWINPMKELDPALVDELLSMTPSSREMNS